jgi:hypothetical protein
VSPGLRVVLAGAMLVGCERSGTGSTPVTRPPIAIDRDAAPLRLPAILERLAVTARSGSELELEAHDWTARAMASCKQLGFPTTLPADVAGRAEALAPGAGLTFVDRDGATPIVVRELGCTSPGEFDPPTVIVHFDASRSLHTRPRSARAMQRAPTELVVAGAVHPDARLRAPEAIDLAAPAAADVRAAVEESVELGLSCMSGDSPERDEEAALAWAKSVVATSSASWVSSRPHRLVFVIFDDACPEDPQSIGLLVDPESVTTEAETRASEGIDIDAIVDLDGDGIDEVLLHLTQMEDGGEDLELLVASDGKWDSVRLWSAETP